jgi:hypothetical protein
MTTLLLLKREWPSREEDPTLLKPLEAPIILKVVANKNLSSA